MKTIIIIFLVAFLSVSAISLAEISPVEACLRRKIADSLSPPPSNKLKLHHFRHVVGFSTPKVLYPHVIDPEKPKLDDFDSHAMGFDICSDETRLVRYSLKLNGKFPTYYVKALCNIFGDDDNKVKDYVAENWFKYSNKRIIIRSCATL